MENTTKQAGFPQAVVIIATSLLPMMAIVALMPVIPAIKENFKDMPPFFGLGIDTLAPMVVSAPGLCMALLSPYAGYLTDKLGRRKLLLVFPLLYGLGGILPFFFQSFPALMGGRLLLGVGEAFIMTIGNTLLGDYFNEKDRAKWLMWQSVIGSGCGSLLLSLSGRLAGFGWNYPFLVYSLAFLISAAAYFFIFEPNRKKETEQTISTNNSPFPLKTVLVMALTTLLVATLYFVYTLQFSTLLREAYGIKSTRDLGDRMMIVSFAVPLGGLLYGLVSKKSSAFQFVCLFGLIGLGLTIIGLSNNISMAIAGAAIQQSGAGMAVPIIIAWGLKQLPEEFRGRGMGWWTSGFFLGQFISPLVVSAVRGLVGGNWLTTFMVFGLICLGIAAYNAVLSQKKVVEG